ncbi:MAG: carbohydrate-binding family 9-like protein [Bacteroidales bacterium]|nr:carbohydrate-binding family 9-like protein [Bacteroidales bacterium]
MTIKETSSYICYRTSSPISVDGDLDKAVWRNARRSQRFVDMISGTPGFFNTQAAALWDDEALYIAFWIEEPFVEARLTKRDSTIFQENDVEVFIDGGDCYYEFEINALNTVYEVFFIWQDAWHKFDSKEFDVHSREAYTFGGNHDRDAETFWRGNHPRGLRWAFTDWDFPGLRTAVKIQGTLNDNSDIDKGWTVEIAFPWKGMTQLAGGRSLPPEDSDIWRIFLGRFGKLAAGNNLVSNSMSLDVVGDNDNHLPERFTRVSFSTLTTPDDLAFVSDL